MTAACPSEPGLTTAVLAQAWADVASWTAPMPRAQAEHLLTRLIDRLVRVVTTAPADDQATIDVAAELITHGLTEPRELSRSIEVLAEGLPRLTGLHEVPQLDTAVLRVLTSLVSRYAEALQQRTVDEHELATRALRQAKHEAELELRICEIRFREIFSTSAVGIAISTFDGAVVTANRAFADIVGHQPVDLIGAALPELLQARDDLALAEAYRRLASGELTRIRHRRQLTATTGEVAWTHLGVSLLRDADQVPTHHLTVVENVTELHLLQRELANQALHDVLTGLPNEQYLMSHLQKVLGTAGPSTMVTMCRVNLDNFAVITDGIDRAAGDALLCSVALRLHKLVAGQQAMVARLGADDFAILIEDGPGSPDPRGFAASINSTLREPFYVENRGLVVCAGVGVAHLPASGISPTELIRAADTALHQAKHSGAGQWGLYDAPADARQRRLHQRATAMPGDFENGRIRPRYQPVHGLHTGWIVALQALLRWEPAEDTVVEHHECLTLAARTGLVIDLGHWMLREACGVQNVVSHCPTSGGPRMRVDLTERLSQDPDLRTVMSGALSMTGLPADQLRVGVPLTTLAGGREPVMDNVRALAALGVEVVLLGAAAGLEYLAYLEDLPIGAVEMAPAVVSRIAQRSGDDSVVVQALRQAIALVHDTGATVLVPGVDTAAQAQWWRDAGADAARGAHFGPPVWDHQLPALLTTAFLDREP